MSIGYCIYLLHWFHSFGGKYPIYIMQTRWLIQNNKVDDNNVFFSFLSKRPTCKADNYLSANQHALVSARPWSRWYGYLCNDPIARIKMPLSACTFRKEKKRKSKSKEGLSHKGNLKKYTVGTSLRSKSQLYTASPLTGSKFGLNSHMTEMNYIGKGSVYAQIIRWYPHFLSGFLCFFSYLRERYKYCSE